MSDIKYRVEKIVRGKLTDYFETGCEGVYWAIQEDGKEGYEGLNTFGHGMMHLKVIHPTGKILLNQHVYLISSHDMQLINPKRMPAAYKKLSARIEQWPSGKGKQFTARGLWVHHLPMNVNLELWDSLFLDENDNCAIAVFYEREPF